MPVNDERELGQFIPMHYHYQMLADNERVQAFAAAIRSQIRPGQHVVDLGSGTGLMSFLAAQAGAFVQSVERIPALAEASRGFLANNGMASRVRVINADAREWLPEAPVDFVICEMLHSGLLREQQLAVLASFREGHRQRFGCIPRFIPEITLLGLQPVLQNYNFAGYYAPVPLFHYPYAPTPDSIDCGDPIIYAQIDYSTNEPGRLDIQLPLQPNPNFNAIRFITKSILAVDLDSHSTIDWHSQYLVLPVAVTPPLAHQQQGQLSFSYPIGAPLETLSESLHFQWVE